MEYADYKKFEANLILLKDILERKDPREELSSLVMAMEKILSYLPEEVFSFSILWTEDTCLAITRNDSISTDELNLKNVENYFSSIPIPKH